MTSKPTAMTLVSALLVGALMLPAFGQSANLANPSALKETAPATYKVRFETSKGAFVVDVTRDWAPNGADRFYNLVKNGFYDGARFFRVIDGFMAQFGINGDPKISAAWREARIQDDPVKQSNRRGFITYAMAGPNTRTSQLFINYNDQQLARQAGIFTVRPRVVRDGGGRRAAQRLRRKSEPGAHPDGRQRLSGQELSAARLRQEGNDHQVIVI